MARPMKPLVKSGGYYPSRRWTPLVYPGGYTTMNGGEPPIPIEWKTVSGSAPLTFSDALSNEIRSLIQYGKCVTSGGDTYCNNGKLVAVHRSGLPSGYKLLEYVGGNGSQYVITDLYLASTDVVECEYRNSSTTGYGAVYGIFKNGESSALYGNQTYYGYDEANNKVDTGMSVDTNWHSSRHDFVNGTLTIDNTSVSFTPFEFVNSTKNAVLSRFYNGSYGYNWKGFVRKFKVTRGNEVVCDLLPAKNSSNEAGLYDLISGSFYTATGGTLIEGNEVDDYELQVVGTPEVLTVIQNQNTDPTIIKATLAGGRTEVRYSASSSCIVAPVKPNTVYTIGFLEKPTGGSIFRVATTRTQVSSSISSAASIAYDLKNDYEPKTLNSGAEAAWMYVQLSNIMSDEDFASILIQEGTSLTPPQTASVVNLFSTGTVHDEHEVISGTVTRRTAVSVSGGVVTISALATPVTEHITPQPLNTNEGDNIVSVTANVSPIQLSAEYAILSEAG